MGQSILEMLFEHNQWANRELARVCFSLSEAQLDAEPRSATKGAIRGTLLHLATAQRGYLALLTLPVEARPTTPLAFEEIPASLESSGAGLLALAKDGASPRLQGRLRTRDGYDAAPWVVMVQAINHATEHREQIKSMLSALGLTPPDLDGWTYGVVTHALSPVEG